MSVPRFPVVALAALALGGTAIGFAGILMRLADVNPLASAFWRMALAAPLLWGWAFATRKRDRCAGKRTDFSPALVLAGVYFAGDMGLWHLSLHHTTVANATLLSNLAPIVIALWLWGMHRVRFGRQYLMGIGLALGGALLLLNPSGAPGAGGGDHKLLGDSLGLASAVAYAAYQLQIKEARDVYSTARLMAWSTSCTALALLPFALWMDGPFFPASLPGWMPLLALAFLGQVAGQTIIAYASAHLPAAVSSVGLLVQPLTAALAAWLLFAEAMGPWQIMGGSVLLLGVYLARRGPG